MGMQWTEDSGQVPGRTGEWREEVDSQRSFRSEWTGLGDSLAEPSNRKRKVKDDLWYHHILGSWYHLGYLMASLLRVYGVGIHGSQAQLDFQPGPTTLLCLQSTLNPHGGNLKLSHS